MMLALAALMATAAFAERVHNLPGYSGNDTMYSGYITVDKDHGRQLFYFHVEAASDPNGDVPVVLWLNGGPGCSSIGGGLATENGFGMVQEDEKGETSWHGNPWSWNRAAHMVYLESPAGVGFSFSDDASDYTVGDNRTAEDSWRFLQGFFAEFPHLQGRKFYITGESYAGHYIPTLALAILQHNANGDGNNINFAGFAVGNAWTWSELDNKGAAMDWFAHSMVMEETLQGMLATCNFSDVGPLRLGAEQKDPGAEQKATLGLLGARMGRLGSKSAGFGKAQVESAVLAAVDAKSCNDYVNDAFDQLGSVNIYQINAFTCQSGLHEHAHRAVSSFWPQASGFAASRRLEGVEGDDYMSSNVESGSAAWYEPCIDSYAQKYFNRDDVKAAIHANASIHWTDCSNKVDYSRADLLASMLPVYERIFELGPDLHITIYSGLFDAIVPTPGTKLWLQALENASVIEKQGGLHTWNTPNQQIGGWTQEYNKLNFTTIRAAGHMVPADQPSRALYFLQQFLRNQPL